jgi:hypothetical protein
VWFIAGLFVLLAVPISAYGVQGHMEHYSRPTLQKHVVRILWMPVVYGLDAWLALRFKVRAAALAGAAGVCARHSRACARRQRLRATRAAPLTRAACLPKYAMCVTRRTTPSTLTRCASATRRS